MRAWVLAFAVLLGASALVLGVGCAHEPRTKIENTQRFDPTLPAFPVNPRGCLGDPRQPATCVWPAGRVGSAP